MVKKRERERDVESDVTRKKTMIRQWVLYLLASQSRNIWKEMRKLKEGDIERGKEHGNLEFSTTFSQWELLTYF